MKSVEVASLCVHKELEVGKALNLDARLNRLTK